MSGIEIVSDAELLNIDDYTYFNDKRYKGLISNSRLNLLDSDSGGSIKAFLNGFGPQEYNQSFVIGSAVHGLVLQPESYRMYEGDAPSGKMTVFAQYFIDRGISELTDDAIGRAISEIGYRGNDVTPSKISFVRIACQRFVKEFLSVNKDKVDGMVILPKKERETVDKCVNALRSNMKTSEILFAENDEDEEVYNENTITLVISVNVRGKQYPMGIKGKLDRFVVCDDGRVKLYDLKTTGHSVAMFGESFKKYKYYRQAAFYEFLLAALGYETKSIEFVVVSTYDYSTRVYRPAKEDVRRGHEELSRLFKLAAEVFMDHSYRRDFENRYSIKRYPVKFASKMKLLGLLCYLLQRFRKKEKDFTVRNLIERIRKERISNTSDDMIDRLTVWVEEFYSDDEAYPNFKMESLKDMAEYINNVMDKELPFHFSDYTDDLPF